MRESFTRNYKITFYILEIHFAAQIEILGRLEDSPPGGRGCGFRLKRVRIFRCGNKSEAVCPWWKRRGLTDVWLPDGL